MPSLHWQPFAESFSSYQRSFNIVRQNILAGNSFLTNLTCRTPVETNLTLNDIYFHSKAIYKLWIKDRFTVFSPEIFVRIHQGKISSYPMKGTIDASIPFAAQRITSRFKKLVVIYACAVFVVVHTALPDFCIFFFLFRCVLRKIFCPAVTGSASVPTSIADLSV